MADIRSLASGLYPSLLLERGLVEALSEAAAACPLPTTLTAESVGRYPPEVEGAVYFCCREALQNAAKHATGASSVVVKLWEAEAEAVHFEVRDDGAGMSQPRAAGAPASPICATGSGPWGAAWRSSRILGAEHA